MCHNQIKVLERFLAVKRGVLERGENRHRDGG